MEFQPLIHPGIHRTHPDIGQQDILEVWRNAIVSAPVVNNQETRQVWLTLGFDGQGRLMELASIHDQSRLWLVFHAMTPPSPKTLREFLATGRD
ncbi:hypothetical protein [Bifidobacterium indicum]|uniref:hypothetical protein n=1 Tax=Bifidobacterium indicum TaxID=1691 RepID=UPI0030DAED39